MKFTTQDISLILVTAVSTAIITAAVAYTLYPDCKEEMIVYPDNPVSERISWEEATTGRNEYLNFKPLLVKYADPTTGSDQISRLKGFTFEAAHLKEIINQNSSSRGNPDKITFYLSQNGTFSDNSSGTTIEYGNINLIAVGVKNNRQLIDDILSGRQLSVFDKADPCPPNCPD